MTMHAPVPSDVEPDGLAELIADAQAVPQARRRRVVLTTAIPTQRRREVTIPELTVAMADGYADYGSC